MSLSSWLDGIGLSQICGALENFGITTVKELSVLRDSDLKDIVNELNLKSLHRIKFNVAVRKLELDDGQRLVLTPEEFKAMQELSKLTKSAKIVLTNVEKSMEAVRVNGNKSRKDIDKEFSLCREHLKKREKTLLAQVQLKEKQKLDALEKQANELTTIIARLTQAKMDGEKLMKISTLEGITNREKLVTESIVKAVKLQFTRNLVLNADIRFGGDLHKLQKNIEDHGKVLTYGPITPPIVTKLEAAGETIQVFWDVSCEPGAEQLNSLGFGIQVTECSSTSDEGLHGLQKEYESDSKEESYLVKNLKRATNYKIAVKVKTKFGWSVFGKPSHIKTEAEPELKTFEASWDPNHKGPRFQLSNSNKTVTFEGNRIHNTVYEKQAMKSGKHQLNVRIDEIVPGEEYGVCVGIGESSRGCTNTYLAASRRGYCYLACTGQKDECGNPTAYADACKIGDVVSILLNLDERTLSFQRNGTDLNPQPAFRNIKEDTYYFGAWMYGTGGKITIV